MFLIFFQLRTHTRLTKCVSYESQSYLKHVDARKFHQTYYFYKFSNFFQLGVHARYVQNNHKWKDKT